MRDEIEKIVNSIKNKKHKLLIALSCSVGLRVSEVVNLKTKDLNLADLTIHIKDVKGNKGRISIFSKKLLDDLCDLVNTKDLNEYIFASECTGKLSERSAQKIFKNALKQSEIKKEATFHSLRHSFATHLLKNKVDIRDLQGLLGNANIRTTQIYIKVTNPKLKNIKSPL